MRCPKCLGLIIEAYNERQEFEPYCLNCSHRPIVVPPPPQCAYVSRVTGRCTESPNRESDYCPMHYTILQHRGERGKGQHRSGEASKLAQKRKLAPSGAA